MCFIFGQVGKNYKATAEMFHERHPFRPKPAVSTVQRLITRFRNTGSVLNKKKVRPKSATNDEVATGVLANVSVDPHISTRRLAGDHGISQASVINILRAHKYHPYKMQLRHTLLDADYPKRREFCEWALRKLHENPAWSEDVVFSDEALFYLNGTVNTQNYRYWSDVNPHWMEGVKSLNSPRVMVWCGIYHDTIVGPFFFEGSVTGKAYLAMLRSFVQDWLDTIPLVPLMNMWFQQDGASSHFVVAVRKWLDETFPGKWIGRGGPVAWPPRSPDITPMDFYFWGFIKSLVYIDRPQTLQELKQRIIAATRAVRPETLQHVRDGLKSRLEHVIAVNGRHIEHLR